MSTATPIPKQMTTATQSLRRRRYLRLVGYQIQRATDAAKQVAAATDNLCRHRAACARAQVAGLLREAVESINAYDRSLAALNAAQADLAKHLDKLDRMALEAGGTITDTNLDDAIREVLDANAAATMRSAGVF